MTLCGQFASRFDRYSRKDVYRLKNKPHCKNCARCQ